MTTSPWISVKDRLPHSGPILVIFNDGTQGFLQWYPADSVNYRKVQYWMPLPDPPKPEDPFKTWWDSLPKYKGINGREIPLRIIGEYVQDMKSARFIWDAAIASKKTDKQQP